MTVFKKGRSDSRLPSFSNGQNPRANEALGSGTRITTGPSSEAILLFSNGSYATLGPKSDLLIDSFEQQEFEGSIKEIDPLAEEVSPSKIKLELNLGELILKVKKLKKNSSLDVSTPLGIAGVRGTQFRVDLDQDTVGVSVLSGSVSFVDTRQVALTIGKETRLVVTKGAPPKQSALSSAAKSRIESANQAASKKMTRFTLQKLTKAYQEVNQKQTRLDPQNRLERLLAAGGKESTEAAVKHGLDWLKAKQAPDGSWGKNAMGPGGAPSPTDQNAMTGMALLCYLGHRDLLDSPEYGETVRKALRFLTSTPADAFTGRECYSHAIRTEALCTAYVITKGKRLAPWAKTAAEAVVKGQNQSGGWAYGYNKGPTAHVDLSVTGWNIDALTAATLTDLSIEGLNEAMDKAIAYVNAARTRLASSPTRKEAVARQASPAWASLVSKSGTTRNRRKP